MSLELQISSSLFLTSANKRRTFFTRQVLFGVIFFWNHAWKFWVRLIHESLRYVFVRNTCCSCNMSWSVLPLTFFFWWRVISHHPTFWSTKSRIILVCVRNSGFSHILLPTTRDHFRAFNSTATGHFRGKKFKPQSLSQNLFFATNMLSYIRLKGRWNDLFRLQ